jgi:hypothetical protein
MKKQIFVIVLMLVLFSICLTGCVSNVEGDWVLRSYDFEGNIVNEETVTIIQANPVDVTITGAFGQFNGKMTFIAGDQVIKRIPSSPDDLSIDIIYVISSSYMESELPKIEFLDPYTFTKV